mmetsp:Transcript_22653/g.49502  ORF Transcript_22653/g.49502 Transcript_22653/m.49502 type:complete len:657 (-) Transcript_22653:390-2360(-)
METQQQEGTDQYQDWQAGMADREEEEEEETKEETLEAQCAKMMKVLYDSQPTLDYNCDREKTVIIGGRVDAGKSSYWKVLKKWRGTYSTVRNGVKKAVTLEILQELLNGGIKFYAKGKGAPHVLVPVIQMEKIRNRIARDIQKLIRENGTCKEGGKIGDATLAGNGSVESSVSDANEADHRGGGGKEAAEEVARTLANPPVPHVSVPKLSEDSNATGNVATGDDVSSIHEVSTESSLAQKRRSATAEHGTGEKSFANGNSKAENTLERRRSSGSMAEEPEPWHPESVGPPRLTMLESWSQRQVEHLASEDPQEEANDAEKDTSGGEPTNEKGAGIVQNPNDYSAEANGNGKGQSLDGKRKTSQEEAGASPQKRGTLPSDEQQAQIESIVGTMRPQVLASPMRVAVHTFPMVASRASNAVPLLPRPPALPPPHQATQQDWIQIGKPAPMPKEKGGRGAKRGGRKGASQEEPLLDPPSLLISESIGTIQPASSAKRTRRTSTKSAPPAIPPNSKSPAASTAAPRRGRARSAPQGRSSRGSSMNARQRGSTASVAGNVLAPAGQQGSPNTGRTDHFNVVVGEMMGRLQSVERRLFMIESQNRRFRQRLSDLEYEEELRTDGSAGHTSMMAGYHMESADASFEDDEGGALPEEDGNGLSW